MAEHLTKCADCVFWRTPSYSPFEHCCRKAPERRPAPGGDPIDTWSPTAEGDACGEGMTVEEWAVERDARKGPEILEAYRETVEDLKRQLREAGA